MTDFPITEDSVAKPSLPAITVYTDGSSKGNPGSGGVGVVMISGGFRRELSIFLGKVTNNVAELTAIKLALEAIKKRDWPVELYTDSKYAIGVLSGGYKAKKNQELITEIKALMQVFPRLLLIKVEGHTGVAENERADRLACQAADSGKNYDSGTNSV